MKKSEVERLYANYAPRALRRARSILGEEAGARDVIQEIFLRLLPRDDLNPQKVTMAWLYETVTNQCLKHIRDTSRRGRILDLRFRASESVRGDPDARMTVAQLLAAVPEELRAIGIHYYVDQMSQEEIATLMGIPRRTISYRIDQFRRHALAADVALPESP